MLQKKKSDAIAIQNAASNIFLLKSLADFKLMILRKAKKTNTPESITPVLKKLTGTANVKHTNKNKI